MMLWTAGDPAPNPRRIRMFMRLKGIDLPATNLSMLKREHKAPEVLAKNPRGQLPWLELDDGRVIAETIAICRYLDELHPEPPLFGTTAFERAETDMWTRRAEQVLGNPASQLWLHGHPFTAHLLTQIPDMAALARTQVADAMAWFDGQFTGRQWLAGDRLTIADIALVSTIDFLGFIDVPIPDELTHLHAWHQRLTARLA